MFWNVTGKGVSEHYLYLTLVSTSQKSLDCIWQREFSSTYAAFGIISPWTGSCSSMANIHLSCLQPCHTFWVIAPPQASSGNPLFPQQRSNLQPDWEARLITRQNLPVGMHPVYCSRRSPFLQWYRQLSVMVQFQLPNKYPKYLAAAHSRPFPCSPPPKMGRTIRKEKKIELMDWDKNSFITEMNITIIVIKMRGREGDTTKEQVMHNATVHHLLNDDQSAPEPQSPSCSWPTAPSLYSEHDVLWYGTSFWPVWSPVLARLPPRFLCTSSLAEHETLKNPWQRVKAA